MDVLFSKAHVTPRCFPILSKTFGLLTCLLVTLGVRSDPCTF